MKEFSDVVAYLTPKGMPVKTYVVSIQRRWGIDLVLPDDNISHWCTGWMVTAHHMLFKHPIMQKTCVCVAYDSQYKPIPNIDTWCEWDPDLTQVPCDVREVLLQMKK